MIRVGEYNTLTVRKQLAFGLILEDGKDGILLPKRFVPKNAKPGDELTVFLYHDSEDRLIATTQHPKGILGDIVLLRVVSLTPQGAFLDWGLMKDLFVPKSKQLSGMRLGGDYLVKIYLDEQTGRLAATEKIEPFLSNADITLKEKDLVDLTVYRRTDIGYLVIINNRHTGVLHFNEIFRDVKSGDRFPGFIKNIVPPDRAASGETEIDVVAGKPGYERTEDAAAKIIRLLKENKGRLPYHDKSDPEAIYAFFGMSKKTFKMTTGRLYKEKKILITDTGISLITP
ncbi:CvfB family protein [Puia dinghuensis]|uniref:GntR family transcriptional regulator n=1 Tax=Puia dinghuensis TaxID=1792502 RepID=A0A8J2XT95_9BACT|nr:S1-like domain-containing RNA-binding protein [Puia dinghuensis]GGB15556.1 GntR family transcriptional regulator [Puia dinghuensis]